MVEVPEAGCKRLLKVPFRGEAGDAGSRVFPKGLRLLLLVPLPDVVVLLVLLLAVAICGCTCGKEPISGGSMIGEVPCFELMAVCAVGLANVGGGFPELIDTLDLELELEFDVG